MENKDYIKTVAKKQLAGKYVLCNTNRLDEIRGSADEAIDKLYAAKIAFIKDIPKGFGGEKDHSAESYKYKRAIVVLAGPNQYKRLEKGLLEYRNDPSAVLVTPEFGDYFDEKELSKDKGLDRILIGNRSRNTEENAIDAIYKVKLNFPGVEKITIVSDYTDKLRSEILFKKYAGVNYDIDFSGIKTDNKLHRIAYELGALLLSILPYRMNKKLIEKARSTDYKNKE